MRTLRTQAQMPARQHTRILLIRHAHDTLIFLRILDPENLLHIERVQVATELLVDDAGFPPFTLLLQGDE